MGRKKDIGDLARAIKAPSFGNADASPTLTGLDPVSPTTLVLPITDIKPYEHNPRHSENQEYPRLKESIRARRGLTTPLTVTKRPGADLYTIAAGGNSRLRVRNELASETGDDAFAFVTCRFEPWSSEHQVLANHLIENDVRGNMLFSDKARALVEWQRLYEESHREQPPLTQRELADHLAKAGYRLTVSTVNRLIYAAEILMPLLPRAFESGLGRPAVEQLIRLRTLGAKYWQDTVSDEPLPTLTFDDVFAEACARQDAHCADWDFELFQSALTVRMAEVLQIDHKLVALDVDGLYRGHAVEPARVAERQPEPDPQGLRSEWVFDRARELDTIKRERARARSEAKEAGGSTAASEERADGGEPGADAAVSSRPADARPTGDTLRRLRDRNYLAARQLAEGHELDEYLKPIEAGFGFFVEAPEPSEDMAAPTTQPSDATQGVALAGIRAGLWWLLCLAADELDHLAEIGTYYPASWLVELFTAMPERSPETDPSMALSILVGEPTPRGLLWDVLTDPSLTETQLDALNQLLDGCRVLRAASATGEIKLWSPAP